MERTCKEHSEGKPCIKVIAEGVCLKQNCKLFPKVLKFLPKITKLYELQAKGVILTTIWDFSEEAEAKRLRQKIKAEKWLTKLYPKICQELSSPNTHRRNRIGG